MKDKKIYCKKCNEGTFRTREDHVVICQGCGTRTPRKLTRPETILFSELDEKDKAYVENLSTLDPHDQPEIEPSPQYLAIAKRMHKLSKMEKQVLELIISGNTYTETASILGISDGEISTYLNRARIKLK